MADLDAFEQAEDRPVLRIRKRDTMVWAGLSMKSMVSLLGYSDRNS